MKKERKIHRSFIENGFRNWVGKYQYFYSNDNGKFSLIKLINYGGDGDLWEICCVEGRLIDNDEVERFRTKKEAEKRIEELLTP